MMMQMKTMAMVAFWVMVGYGRVGSWGFLVVRLVVDGGRVGVDG